MAKILIPIVVTQNFDEYKRQYKRWDTGESVKREDFKILDQPPVLFFKIKNQLPPQPGLFHHYHSLDYNVIPDDANAVLLSERMHELRQENGDLEIYAASYCNLREKIQEKV